MKKIIVIAILMVVSIWTVSADLSDWLFCLIKKEAVIISLKQTEWFYKCNETIVSLEQLIINTAKDLMKIQSYINKGRDLEYRKAVRDVKKALLEKLQVSRTTILTNINTFQTTLLKKSVQYFIIKITPYKISLQKSLVKIDALVASGFATPSLTSYATLLKAQVTVLDSLSKVTTTKQLNDLLAKYVYLKKEIAWKSE
jgi:hypothetical protein